MAKRKLFRYDQIKQMHHVLEPPLDSMRSDDAWKLRWSDFFGNAKPLVLELGCGGGEYTVALARRDPHRNHIGIDIKGDRIWRGAREAMDSGLDHIAFLRTDISRITYFFAPGSVENIWITFPDPQVKWRRAKHRLTHPDFWDRYFEILPSGGKVRLKTDSDLMYGYTMGVLEGRKDFKVCRAMHDVYRAQEVPEVVLEVQTYYEKKFLAQGATIKYLEVIRL